MRISDWSSDVCSSDLTEGEKGQQIENVRGWQQSRNALAPKGETSHGHMADADEEAPMVHDGHGLAYLQNTARERKNVFEALMEAVKTHRLGQISHALSDVGGQYRRNTYPRQLGRRAGRDIGGKEGGMTG